MKTILVVDDNALNRDLATAMLQRSGFAVQTSSNALDALQMMRATRFDVVITDIGMPQINGIELCKMIIQEFGASRPRLVAFTASAMEFEKDQIVSAGFDDLVTKPATRAVLTKAADPTPHLAQAD